MTSRLTLAAVTAHLSAELDESRFARIGTHHDIDFASAYGKTFNQVWVLGQRVRRQGNRNNATGYSGFLRQHMSIEIALRVVVRRNEPGVTSNEAEVIQTVADVCAALVGWRPPSADEPFLLLEEKDGPIGEAITSVDLVFDTSTTYS